ncbi:competence protein ComEC [Idiomarina aquatica]|uniref:Competence protein ComEC n=2 Tax=Idiomarina aquatica TaxID=1327752 RepID=A0A4R6PKT0_9GAMM|nr:competence protein ComEC [Idiomarina aquatica]
MDRCLLIFIAGVAMSLYLPTSGTATWAVVASVLALAIGTMLPPARFVATAIVALFCGIGVVTANLNSYAERSAQLTDLEGAQQVTVRVVEIPRHYPHYTRFVAELIDGDEENSLPHGKLLLSWYGDRAKQVGLGQTWRFTVSLKRFKNYWNEGSRDYLAAMQRQNIIARGSVKTSELIANASNIRARLVRTFNALDSPHAGVLAALAIGVRELLSEQQRNQWQSAGLMHALAISGLHLSLVGWAGLILGRVGVSRLLPIIRPGMALEQQSVQALSWLLALLIAAAYAWLADFSIATVRALIMFAVVVLHRLVAVHVTPAQLLLRTVALLLLVDPLALLDAGFWLSVTALFTILTTLWRWRHRPQSSKTLALLRLQCMFLLVMAPLSLHWFGGVSLVAPLTNLILLPVISLWMLPLTLIGTVAEISFAHQFADNLWYLATLPLSLAEPLLKVITQWSWSWWQPPIELPVYVLFLLLVLVLLPLSSRLLKLVLLTTLPLTLLAFYQSRTRGESLFVHVLDVGQAQAVVVERQGRAWLIDTGNSYGSGYSLAATVIEPFLQYRQLQLEGIWVSHSDRDHSGGLAYLKQHYSQVSRFGALTRQPCEQGMQGRWNDIQWQVLWPRRDHAITKSNDQSCVMVLQYKNFRLLLPGDIEFAAERKIAESLGFPAVDVLVAAHHGSKTSSGWLMLKQTRPSLILMSNGEHKGFNFPHRYTVSRFNHMQRPWFNSKDVGQMTVVSDGSRWRLRLPFAAKRQRRLYQTHD